MRAETVLKQVRVWFVPSNFVEQPNFDRCFPGRFDMKRVSRDFTRVCKHVFKRIVLVKLSKSFKGFKVRERPTSVRFNSVFIRLVDKTFSVAWIIEPAWKRNYKFIEQCMFSEFWSWSDFVGSLVSGGLTTVLFRIQVL